MSVLRKILYPFSQIYGLITSARNIFYNKGFFKSTSFDIPTIVVGNLSVGGTGKTPQIEYLVRLLQDKYKIAILSRGYKRATEGFIIANATTTVKDIGDEPMQYHLKFDNVIVAVDGDRVNGIRQLSKLTDKPEVILLDDAFQHRKVEGGLNILLTSHDNLYIDDTILPSGNLREKVEGAKRAKIIIVTKCPEQLDEQRQFEIAKKLKVEWYQTVFFTNINYGDEIIGKHGNFGTNELSNFEVVLVTGIANTRPLLDFLDGTKVNYHHLNFSDHHNFSDKDLAKIRSRYAAIKSDKKLILTTEKDYVRSFISLEDAFYYLPIETQFIDHRTDFDQLIEKCIIKIKGI